PPVPQAAPSARVPSTRGALHRSSWSRFKSQRPDVEVKLAALERENLALHPPTECVGDRDGDLEIRREAPADGLVLIALEEPLPRRALLRLVDHRQTSLPFSYASRSIRVSVPSSRRIVAPTAPSARRLTISAGSRMTS